MLKILIVILVLVLLLAVGLNIDFSTKKEFSPLPTPLIKMQEDSINIEEVLVQEKQELHPINIKTDNNLSAEIEALFIKANNYFQNSQDEEAQNIYTLIIKKVRNNNQLKFLKYFAKALQQKAFIFKIYPTYDIESSLETLEIIINKFENTEEFELIEFYINARIEQAHLQSKEESLETYDELIKKFKHRTDSYFTKKIEELLLAKSFALMGENDDEAMEILDEIIEKYQKSGEKNLPDNIKFSILNNIELAVITNNDDTNYRELADTYMSNSPDKAPLLDMLEIIRNSQDLNQDDALKEWQESHNDYHFPDWSFDELRKWAYKMEDKETKERVSQYIDAFENHKYYVPSSKTEYIQEEVTYSTPVEEEVIYETKPVEYTDPYINDLPPVVYTDPYANDTPTVNEKNNTYIIYEPY